MLAAALLVALLAAMAVFQLALVFGAPLGRFAWGGQHRVLPQRLRVGSALGILIYAAIALIALDRADAVDVITFSEIAMWVVFGYFAVSIALNAVSRSKQERLTMVPLTIALTALSLILSLS